MRSFYAFAALMMVIGLAAWAAFFATVEFWGAPVYYSALTLGALLAALHWAPAFNLRPVRSALLLGAVGVGATYTAKILAFLLVVLGGAGLNIYAGAWTTPYWGVSIIVLFVIFAELGLALTWRWLGPKPLVSVQRDEQ